VLAVNRRSIPLDCDATTAAWENFRADWGLPTVCHDHDDDRPVLRVDLYAGELSAPFKDAITWGQRVFVGNGNAVYVIAPQERSSSTIILGSYFGAFTLQRFSSGRIRRGIAAPLSRVK